MSRGSDEVPAAPPLIVLVDRAHRALQQHMARMAKERGYPEAKPAHNAVFGRLSSEGARTVDLAARAGVTRQSMGELVRELVDLGLLEMKPDPADRRAKLVTYTKRGLAEARKGRAHLTTLEERFTEEFGEEEYAVARDVLERVVTVLQQVEFDDR